MKWVQTKKMLDDDGVRKPDERKKFFKEYEHEADLETDLKNPEKFVEWASYPINGDPIDRKAQRKYETFVGGFLHYHDIIFKGYPNGGGYEYPQQIGTPGMPANWKSYDGDTTFEHLIYFEWFPKGKGPNNKTSVVIHINPTPKKFNANPPPPPVPPPPESNE